MDYSSIFQRSWQIVKREKVLWLFGVVLAAFSGGSGGSSSSRSYTRDGLDFFKNNKDSIPKNAGEKISQVLGAVTSDPQTYFQGLLSSIPVSFWITLGLGVVIILLWWLFLSIFVQNWALGALFRLAAESESGKAIDLKTGAAYGQSHWLRLFAAGPLVSLLFLLIFGVVALFFVIFFALFWDATAIRLLLFFLLFLAALAGIVGILIFIIWPTFTAILIAVEDYPVFKALGAGWQLTKRYFFESFILGCLNTAIGCLVGMVMMVFWLMIAGFGLVGILTGVALGDILKNYALLILGIPVSILILLVVSALTTAISGILKAFTSTNWVLFYLDLKKKENFPLTAA